MRGQGAILCSRHLDDATAFVRQLLTESLLLALAAAAVGFVISRVVLEVIVNGYHGQTVSAPARVVVSDRIGLDNYFSACGYAWPSDDEGCDTPGLVAGAEAFTGLTLAAFNGCYRATDFEVRGGDGSGAR